jgi:protein involved in sex pheromone biosynthesis
MLSNTQFLFRYKLFTIKQLTKKQEQIIENLRNKLKKNDILEAIPATLPLFHQPFIKQIIKKRGK